MGYRFKRVRERRRSRIFGLRLKFLLSSILIVVVGIAGLMVSMRLVAPPLFNRIVSHVNGHGLGPGGARGMDQGVRNACMGTLGFNGWIGPFVMILVLAIWAIGTLTSSHRKPLSSRPREDSAMRILRERYARGEIDNQQFEAARRTLQGGSNSPA